MHARCRSQSTYCLIHAVNGLLFQLQSSLANSSMRSRISVLTSLLANSSMRCSWPLRRRSCAISTRTTTTRPCSRNPVTLNIVCILFLFFKEIQNKTDNRLGGAMFVSLSGFTPPFPLYEDGFFPSRHSFNVQGSRYNRVNGELN